MENSSPISILLVDDNEMVRRSLSLFLTMHDDFHLAGEAADGREAVDSCITLKPQVILMDINMPIMNGIEVTKIIRQVAPDVCILALTSLEDNGLVDEIMDAGANAFLLKKASIDEIAYAIRTLCNSNTEQL